ncbi:alpha-amylase family glycosyl hydrolase [Aquibium oceanicum]|uniref:Alpha-amylase n=1 Tax=Aquibium oceanicum TaxID=1670800 RepID=A0A1L3SM75_9HYPH|nr:alpha-amylase family glycosyl hydrolase [Aquibium oceanicum]APH70494.1 alpha-amylase [Aquibium oceanicum]
MPDQIWWKRGIVYQIYPRSFQDTNGDGIGDLEGIRRRLDYLAWLGVEAIWISPFYPSPMADFGYDVCDYRGVDPMFGTMEDFERLVEDAHARDLKVILDFVPNHTSEEHPWFRQSRQSRDNDRRDWYIWRDPAPNGGPPNNWISNFGGSAWQWDEATGQYYYHAFLKEQPDLNWRNREVREAMYDAMRFWLDRGVDGFRVDVIWHLIKDAEFRGNPPNPSFQPSQAEINRFLQVHSADQPEVHEVIAEMRSVLQEYPERVLIGEIYLPLERLVAYYGEDLKGAHLPFNFQLLQASWRAEEIARLIVEYEDKLPDGGWPNWVLGNHDQKRIAARVGLEQARLAGMLLLTLRGTPTMYYGDEIGLGEVQIPPEAVQDPWEKNEPGLGVGRDPARTPMQWEDGANAGFTAGKPWLPLAADNGDCNVACLRDDKNSILSLYHQLIHFRQRHPALSVGSFELSGAEGNVLAFERRHGDERFRIVLNFSKENRSCAIPRGSKARIVLSTALDRTGEELDGSVELRPNEGILATLERD